MFSNAFGLYIPTITPTMEPRRLIMATTTNFGAVGLSRPMRVETRRRPDDTATTPVRPKPTGVPFAGEPTNQQRTTPFGTLHLRISDALDKFEANARTVFNGEQNGLVTQEGRTELLRDAASQPLAEIDAAETAADGLARAADDGYTKTRAGLSPRAASATDALNHSMWWARVSRELDSIPTERVAAACQRLIADADPTELPWAAQELPAYLRSRSVPDDWLDSALHQVHPGLRSAADRRKSTAQAAAIIASNARAARRAISQASSGSYRRPRLVDPAKYDPDAQAEPVDTQRGPTTRDGHRP
jgi:hypothetical protein